MDRLEISGRTNLSGSILVPGAKNATLPIMISSLLSNEGLILNNVDFIISFS